MYKRKLEPVLISLAKQYPVVTLTGPRQSGKTTLCRQAFPRKAYANLENPDTRRLATEDPRGFLAGIPDGAILDEIQRAPQLASYLQEVVDNARRNGLFILTGSQQFEVMSRISQSLAGRTAVLKLLPLSLDEMPHDLQTISLNRLMLAGFYPRLHKERLEPARFYGDYMETCIERDLRQLVSVKDLSIFERFVRLCAGRVGQLLNLHSLGNDAGVSHTTARAWITLLQAGYIIFLLEPHHANVRKRLVKTPKLYFYDTGLACSLLGLENEKQLARDPLRGGLFENLVVMEALKHRLHRGQRSQLTFYRDNVGNEVDLLYGHGIEALPIEVKAGATVGSDFFKGLFHYAKVFPKSRGAALVYAGKEEYLHQGVRIVTVRGLHRLLASQESTPG
jgi:predicted AAA+ superfamily ATPase